MLIEPEVVLCGVPVVVRRLQLIGFDNLSELRVFFDQIANDGGELLGGDAHPVGDGVVADSLLALDALELERRYSTLPAHSTSATAPA